MDTTKHDAQAMLHQAGGIELAVRARTPREHVPYFAGGLLLAGLAPMRDLGNDSAVAGIGQWIVIGAAVALVVTYLRLYRQVRVRPRTPTWLTLTFGAWVLATETFVPRLLDGTIDFSYTLAGVLAAAPLLVWAEWLRKNA